MPNWVFRVSASYQRIRWSICNNVLRVLKSWEESGTEDQNWWGTEIGGFNCNVWRNKNQGSLPDIYALFANQRSLCLAFRVCKVLNRRWRASPNVADIWKVPRRWLPSQNAWLKGISKWGVIHCQEKQRYVCETYSLSGDRGTYFKWQGTRGIKESNLWSYLYINCTKSIDPICKSSNDGSTIGRGTIISNALDQKIGDMCQLGYY